MSGAERIDLGEVDFPDIEPARVWIGGDDARFRAGFGNVTDGGLHEAGFRTVGHIIGDGPTFTPTTEGDNDA